MNAYKDAGFFCDGGYLAYHVFVVVPEFVFRIFAIVGQLTLVSFIAPAPSSFFYVEGARAHAAAAGSVPATPDAVAHVGIGMVTYSCGTDIADKLAQFFDLLIAAG